jgi:hypothetical protein
VWIFGAICPAEGKAGGVVMPYCNSEAMSLHLEEISRHVVPGAHAVITLDQAGCHGSAALVGQSNITLMSLPPRCPELNPVESLWQFMRDNWLSNRDFYPTTTSSTTAASPRTASPMSPGASCPSECDSRHIGCDQCVFV